MLSDPSQVKIKREQAAQARLSDLVSRRSAIAFGCRLHWKAALAAVATCASYHNDVTIAIDPTGLLKKMFGVLGKLDVIYVNSNQICDAIAEYSALDTVNSIGVIVDYSNGEVWLPKLTLPDIDTDLYFVKSHTLRRISAHASRKLRSITNVLYLNRREDGEVVHVPESSTFICDKFIKIITEEDAQYLDKEVPIPSNVFEMKVVRDKHMRGQPSFTDGDVLKEYLHPLLTLPEVLEQKHV